TVIVPLEVQEDVIEEDGGRISLTPNVAGVPAAAMRSAFLAADEVPAVYAMPDADGGRIRVVLNEAQREAVRRMRAAQHLSGREKGQALGAPELRYEGVGEAVKFGPRVVGI